LPKYAVVRQVEEGRETSWGERGRLRSERLLQREREREIGKQEGGWNRFSAA